MRTLTAAFAACVAMAISAAPEKIADVQFASKENLVAAAMKFGELSGNQAAGSMCVAGLSNAPEDFLKACGSSRLAVYADFAAAKDLDEAFSAAEPRYEQAPALSAGCVVKATVAKGVIAKLAAGLEKELAKDSADAAEMKECLDVLKSIDSAGISAFVTDKGIDLDFFFVPVAGTELSKVGLKKFSVKDPFSGTAPDALAVCAYAADSGQKDVNAIVGKLIEVAGKYGISTKWISLSKAGRDTRIVIDLPGLVQFATAELGEAIAKLGDGSAAAKDFQAALGGGFQATGPEQTVSFGIKGAKPYAAPSRRFAATLPEAAARPGFGYTVCSYYSLVKNIAQQIAKLPVMSGDQMFSTIVSTLPSDAGCDIAAVAWREGPAMRCFVRANPAEIKGISAAVMAGVGYFSQKMAAAQAPLIEGDEDDDKN